MIQIFNLFNIRDANLEKAIDKNKGEVVVELANTTDYDINHIVSPVYIGWGDLWKAPIYRKNAEMIFSEVKRKTSYLCDGIQNNKYYHPQYLMNYGRNNVYCIRELTRFLKGEYHSEDVDNINELICLKQMIHTDDVISKIVNRTSLTYEYFCNGNDGFKRHNGTISIGLEYNNHNYILSVLSKGNHPELFSKMIKDFCKTDGLFKINNNNGVSFMAETNTTSVAEFIERLLKEMKRYREKDFSK